MFFFLLNNIVIPLPSMLPFLVCLFNNNILRSIIPNISSREKKKNEEVIYELPRYEDDILDPPS